MAMSRVGPGSSLNHTKSSLTFGLITLLFVTQCASYSIDRHPAREPLSEAQLQWRPSSNIRPVAGLLGREVLRGPRDFEMLDAQPKDYYLLSGGDFNAESLDPHSLGSETDEVYESGQNDRTLGGGEADLLAELLRAYKVAPDDQAGNSLSLGQDSDLSNSDSITSSSNLVSIPDSSLDTEEETSFDQGQMRNSDSLTYSLPSSDTVNLPGNKLNSLLHGSEIDLNDSNVGNIDKDDQPNEDLARQLRDKPKGRGLTTLLDEDEEAEALKSLGVSPIEAKQSVDKDDGKKTNSTKDHLINDNAVGSQIDAKSANWTLGNSLHGLYNRISKFVTSYLHQNGISAVNASSEAPAVISHQEGPDPERSVVSNNDKPDRRKGQSAATAASSTSSPKTETEPPSSGLQANELETNELAADQLDESNGAQQIGRPAKKLATFAPHDTINGNTDSNNRISLMRQSSILLPMGSSDELLGTRRPADALGKYSFEPEMRYAQSQPSFGHLSQRTYLDNQEQSMDGPYSVYHNSYVPIRYESQRAFGDRHQQSGLNQSNDVLFLSMVVAFCAMSVTVVIAAGIFVYRVQQSRKSTLDTDYPTYGVVGPNNMSAKCNAASFVGGYFGSSGGGGVNCTGSGANCKVKAGTIKQLSDYHVDPNSSFKKGKHSTSDTVNQAGISQLPGQNAGLPSATRKNSLISNQNAARMYHYQHQKQQMIISDRVSAGRHTSASDLDSEDEIDDGTYTVYECPGLASAHEMEIKNPLFRDDHSP